MKQPHEYLATKPLAMEQKFHFNGNPVMPLPAGQKCVRHMQKHGLNEDKAPLAIRDYNGCGYWVCEHCYSILSDEFDDDYA